MKILDRAVPEFTEADVFFIFFTLLVTALIYAGPAVVLDAIVRIIVLFFTSPLDNLIGWISTYVILLYAFCVLAVSLYYPLSKKVPGRFAASNMVLWSLIFIAALSIYNGIYWFVEFTSNPTDMGLVWVIFPLLGLIQGAVILILIRYHRVDYHKKFKYRNAHRNQILIGSVIILAIILAGFLGNYDVLLMMLIAIETATWFVKGLTRALPQFFMEGNIIYSMNLPGNEHAEK